MKSMKQYIGTKMLMAVAMTLGEYNKSKGWTIPENEDPNKEGYQVKYSDDYISWSPKEVFEESYRRTNGMNFGLATEMAKKGSKVARAGWNGSGMFAYIVPSNAYPASTQAMKDYFKGELVPYRAYWALKTAQEDIATWSPSGSDSLAEDWVIVE